MSGNDSPNSEMSGKTTSRCRQSEISDVRHLLGNKMPALDVVSGLIHNSTYSAFVRHSLLGVLCYLINNFLDFFPSVELYILKPGHGTVEHWTFLRQKPQRGRYLFPGQSLMYFNRMFNCLSSDTYGCPAESHSRSYRYDLFSRTTTELLSQQ